MVNFKYPCNNVYILSCIYTKYSMFCVAIHGKSHIVPHFLYIFQKNAPLLYKKTKPCPQTQLRKICYCQGLFFNSAVITVEFG